MQLRPLLALQRDSIPLPGPALLLSRHSTCRPANRCCWPLSSAPMQRWRPREARRRSSPSWPTCTRAGRAHTATRCSSLCRDTSRWAALAAGGGDRRGAAAPRLPAGALGWHSGSGILCAEGCHMRLGLLCLLLCSATLPPGSGWSRHVWHPSLRRALSRRCNQRCHPRWPRKWRPRQLQKGQAEMPPLRRLQQQPRLGQQQGRRHQQQRHQRRQGCCRLDSSQQPPGSLQRP